MKNYYEILEVDKNASEEVIEKAYRTLVKKYHPDLQKTQGKKTSQTKMQEINEAYDVLSNDFKRREYDAQLKEKNISIEEYNKIKQENVKLKNDLQRVATQYNKQVEVNRNTMQYAGKYYDELRKKVNTQLNSTPRKKLTKEKIKKIIIYIGIILVIIFLLAVIPVTRNFFVDLYNNNKIVQIIVDIFKETFSRGF